MSSEPPAAAASHAGAEQALPAARPPSWARPFASGRRRANWAIALLAIAAIVDIARAALNYRRPPGPAAPGHALALYEANDWLAQVAMIAAIILFAIWTHRVYRNLPALGVERPRFTPAWAVAWLFIPLANLVAPYFVFVEIWRGSLPKSPAESASGKSPRRRSILLLAWWGANIAPAVIFIVGIAVLIFMYAKLMAQRALSPAEKADQLTRTIADFEATLQRLNNFELPLVGAFAAILAIFLVRRIDKNQQLRFERQQSK